ncbi:DUF4167 domain-containing protein [Pseudotabrizicola algicola]|uniref:DUF4167 domain-containing protein n=1 Tax=Pseudotabrizicola algicola TaxID=2709381 RepID=A0A6B3RLI6_9RHOB|nr:DUF4167 domain-containing protein [Pseudotabrizicola algicola]NEX45135.1 DUF4167 domain-containing protein [Pseudotabrizicola algicola]
MRSSKSRSRSKQNRPRTLGNIINRVFESSGPEGKVRGTPQQIIEKYQLLARDAQLSNDRVAAENFLQHAEHYTRMLSEAQREMAAEQEARQQQFGQNGQNGGQNGGRDGRDQRPWRDDRGAEAGYGEQPEAGVIEDPRGEDTSLVETPEARPAGDAGRREDRSRRNDRSDGDRNRSREDNRNNRGPRPPRNERGPERGDDRANAAADGGAQAPEAETRGAERPQADRAAAERPVEAPQAPAAEASAQPEAAVKQEAGAKPEAEAKVRRPRAPRKPKDSAEKPGDKGPREAAE